MNNNIKNKFKRTEAGINNMIYGKVPPQAGELEGAILGAILLVKDAFDISTEILRPECFYSDSNQKIFRSMISLAKKNMPIDLMTVIEELKLSDDLDTIGGPYYLTKLTNAVVSHANIETHCRIVLQKFIGREMIRISGEIITAVYNEQDDIFTLLETAEKNILEIGNASAGSGMIPIEKVLVDAIKKIEEWRKNDSTLTGVPTGFPELDRVTRGWQPGDLIILAARTSGGKTAFALNIVRSASLNKTKPVTVACWSLEMKAVYLVLRMLAAESKIILYKIQTGRLDDTEMAELINKGANVLSKANIFFDETSSINLRSLKAKCRRLKKKHNLGLVVIDYLQLMSVEEKKGNREQEIAGISRDLKNLAQELDVPIIALSQLSREGTKGVTYESEGPPVSALRESGAIEQDADLIMMLWGPTDDEIAENNALYGKRKIKIVKQRNGMLLKIELDFKGEIQLFESIENISNGNWKPVGDTWKSFKE